MMEVLEIKDPKDGMCEVTLEMSEEESRTLIEIAVNKILREELDKGDDNEQRSCDCSK